MAALHLTFVAWAYGFAAAVLLALIVWIALDYRAQKTKLEALEALEARRGKK
jgi:heme exporter protein CcmD